MARYRPDVMRIQEWSGTNMVWSGAAPDEVKPIYRLLGCLRSLKLITHSTLLNSTVRFKVSKLVLNKIREET